MHSLSLGISESQYMMKHSLQLLIEEDSQVAYSKIFNTYWDSLCQHTYKRVKDMDAVEDILQELFVQLWERRKTLDKDMDLQKYLFGAARYKVFDYFHRSQKHAVLFESLSENLHQFVQDNPDNLETYLALERIVDEELAKMSANMREVVLLRWQAYPISKIAAKLNLSEQTVKNNIHEANKRIRKKVLEAGDNLDVAFMLVFISYLSEKV